MEPIIPHESGDRALNRRVSSDFPLTNDSPVTKFERDGVVAILDRLGTLPFLQIRESAPPWGNPRLSFAVGEAQGAILRDRVHEVWKFYRERFKAFSDETLQSHAEHFEKVIERFGPAYADEIRGIAHGAGLETWKLFALNSRTELINRAKSSAPIPGECTSACFKDEGVLGQTWDWGVRLSDLMVAVEITRPDGHTVFFLGEPGIIGKMGMNSAGVGVALNILGGSGRCDGVPIHVLLRAALDSNSFDEALGRLQCAKQLGTMSHILIADDDGKHALLEFHGGKVHVRRASEDACHTNHYLDPSIEPVKDDYSGLNSKTRLARVQFLLENLTERTVDGMKRILTDTENGEHSISAKPKHYPDYGMDIGTIVTVVMDLPHRTIHFSHTASEQSDFVAHEVKGPTSEMV